MTMTSMELVTREKQDKRASDRKEARQRAFVETMERRRRFMESVKTDPDMEWLVEWSRRQ